MKLFDTDILIDHFHGNRGAFETLSQALTSGEDVLISVVSLAEFTGGMLAGEEARTQQLLSLFRPIEVSEQIAKEAGRYLRQFHKSHRVETADALIAATAFVLQAELMTRNAKHYPMTDIVVTVPYVRGG